MKKRAMKKWIPKDTPYCYAALKPIKGSYGVRYVGHCPWRTIRTCTDEHGTHEEYFCLYTGQFDQGLLWDAVKECGEHDTFKNEAINEIRYAKWLYRNRNNKKLQPWQTTIRKSE